MDGFFREQQARYLTTLTHINAIMQVGNSIIAASAGEQAPSGDGLSKSLKALKEILMPESVWDSEAKAKRAMDLLQSEVAKGGMTVRPVGTRKKKAKRKG